MSRERPESHATTRPAIELAAVVALVAVDLWLAADRLWLQVLTRGLAATVVVASLWRRRWRRDAPAMPARRAWLEATAATLALGVAVTAWAWGASGPFDEPDLAVLKGSTATLGLWLLRRVALALVQQVALQLFLWPVAWKVLRHDTLTTVAAAIVFGLLHLPSVALATATAIAAGLWLGLYRRSRRLAPLIASHALLAALASLLPDRLLLDLKVGEPALEVAAVERLLAGEERQALLRAVSSTRYFETRGGTDDGYVAGLYRDVLGRQATEDEVRDSVEQIRATSRLTLAKRLLIAGELDDATLWRRFVDDEPLPPAVEIAADSDDADWSGWHPAEDGWRWALDATPAIGFRAERAPERLHVLAISAGAAAPVEVEVELKGKAVGRTRFTAIHPHDRRFVVDADRLADGDNTLRFRVSGQPDVPEGETRALGFGLRQARVAPLRFPAAAILHLDDDYFLDGFSIAEKRLRWSRATSARLVYPLPRVVADGCYVLRLRAGAFEHQRIGVSINSQSVADWTLDGLEPQIRSTRLDAALLRAGPNLVDFDLPDAVRPAGDPRRLGLALVSLRIHPLRDCQ